jgi:hypothetical protein
LVLGHIQRNPVNYRTAFTQQTKILDQKFKDQCVVAWDGGLFLVTPEFLAGLKLIKQPAEWVLDMNQTPIWIPQVEFFYEQAYNVYYTALSDYGTAFSQLKSQRSVETILDL